MQQYVQSVISLTVKLSATITPMLNGLLQQQKKTSITETVPVAVKLAEKLLIVLTVNGHMIPYTTSIPANAVITKKLNTA